MPNSNVNNDHISFEDQQKIDKAWATIMEILSKKARNLTAQERLKYGSVSEENKLVVHKVLEYNRNQPHLNCPDVDYQEMMQDWNDRMYFAGLISRMTEATNIANNIRITHDYDAFQNAKTDYDYTKYKMNTDPGAGFEPKYNDLLYFFKTNKGSKKDGEPTEEGDKKNESKEEKTGGNAGQGI